MYQVRIIPEPHIRDKNFQTRVDYLLEIDSYMNNIKNDLLKWKNIAGPDDKLILMFVGDVFDNSMSDLSIFLKWIKFFAELNSITGGNLYSVVGNHEITYKYYNPFWMMADIKSDWVSNAGILNSSVQSVMPIIKVRDEVVIGDKLFVMGHYNRNLNFMTDEWIEKHYPNIKEVVLLSHNEIVDNNIRKHFKEQLGFDVLLGRVSHPDFCKSGYIPPTKYLKDVFIGHMHTAYGDYPLEVKYSLQRYDGDDEDVLADNDGLRYSVIGRDEFVESGFSKEDRVLSTELHYLASIGRTNVNEIRSNFTKRRIPVISFDSTDYGWSSLEVGYYPFQLVGEVAIDKEEYVKRREQYNSAAEIRAIRETTIKLSDPTEDLKSILSYNMSFNSSRFINKLL